MAGDREQGLAASETNRRKYGDDYYARIGSIGGSKVGVKKGLAAMSPERRAEISRMGGKASRKGSRGGKDNTSRPSTSPEE